jgi:hypothetical protein
VRPGLAEDAFLFLGLFSFLRPGFTEGVFVLGRGLAGPECFPFLLLLLLIGPNLTLPFLTEKRKQKKEKSRSLPPRRAWDDKQEDAGFPVRAETPGLLGVNATRKSTATLKS